MTRRFKPKCNYTRKQGTARWHVQDNQQPCVGGFYFTTKRDAQDYADELEPGKETP